MDVLALCFELLSLVVILQIDWDFQISLMMNKNTVEYAVLCRAKVNTEFHLNAAANNDFPTCVTVSVYDANVITNALLTLLMYKISDRSSLMILFGSPVDVKLLYYV